MMPGSLARLIVILLVPALIADPVTASALYQPLSSSEQSYSHPDAIHNLFQEEAITALLRHFTGSAVIDPHHTVSKELKMEAQADQLEKAAQTAFDQVESIVSSSRISLVPPEEYASLADTLSELGLKEDTEWEQSRNAYFNFLNMSRMLRSTDVLAAFVARNSGGQIIGARVLLTPEIVSDVGPEPIITGDDAVRAQDQQRGFGTLLRETAFEWMIDHGHLLYGAYISDSNKASKANLYKVAESMGVSPRVIKIPGKNESWYVLDFRDRRPAGPSQDVRTQRPDAGKLLPYVSLLDPWRRAKFQNQTALYKRDMIWVAPGWENLILVMLRIAFGWVGASILFAVLHTLLEWIHRSQQPANKRERLGVLLPRQIFELLVRTGLSCVLLSPFLLLRWSDPSDLFWRSVLAILATVTSYGLHAGWNALVVNGDLPGMPAMTLWKRSDASTASSGQASPETPGAPPARPPEPFLTIALLGRRGAGKGTLGNRLSHDLGRPYLSVGEFKRKVAGSLPEGIILSLGEMTFHINQELKKTIYQFGYVIDSAQSIWELRSMRRLNILRPSTLFLNLDISPETSGHRVAARRQAALDAGQAPRHGDPLNAHEKRLRRFNNNVGPLLQELVGRAHYASIDAEKTEAEVYRQVLPVVRAWLSSLAAALPPEKTQEKASIDQLIIKLENLERTPTIAADTAAPPAASRKFSEPQSFSHLLALAEEAVAEKNFPIAEELLRRAPAFVASGAAVPRNWLDRLYFSGSILFEGLLHADQISEAERIFDGMYPPDHPIQGNRSQFLSMSNRLIKALLPNRVHDAHARFTRALRVFEEHPDDGALYKERLYLFMTNKNLAMRFAETGDLEKGQQVLDGARVFATKHPSNEISKRLYMLEEVQAFIDRARAPLPPPSVVPLKTPKGKGKEHLVLAMAATLVLGFLALPQAYGQTSGVNIQNGFSLLSALVDVFIGLVALYVLLSFFRLLLRGELGKPQVRPSDDAEPARIPIRHGKLDSTLIIFSVFVFMIGDFEIATSGLTHLSNWPQFLPKFLLFYSLYLFFDANIIFNRKAKQQKEFTLSLSQVLQKIKVYSVFIIADISMMVVGFHYGVYLLILAGSVFGGGHFLFRLFYWNRWQNWRHAQEEAA